MNRETPPEPAAPQTTQQPSVQDDLPERPEKRSGFLGMILDVWTDRDLDMEGCDTSEWNIFYYYFRHIYQKRAMIKLSHLKWCALLFQVIFFAVLALGLAIVLFNYRKRGILDLDSLLVGFLSLGSVFSLQYLIPLFPFLPVFMVTPAFRLRSKNRGFMTSRAKEPPLLAHLVLYTSNKGMVAGALQSLLFTWRKFAILLLPCVLTSILMLVLYSLYMAETPGQITAAIGSPILVVLFILTLTLFIVMQGFCFRMDTLIVMVLAGIAAALTLFDVGTRHAHDFWIALTCCCIPAFLFAWVYFPLAAMDTNEYGIGERTSKRIRILLFTAAAVFLVLVQLAKAFFPEATYPYTRVFRLLFSFFIWGVFACVSGLLVTSNSATSHNAKLLRDRTDKPFRRKLFDPASMFSLFPVFALELLSLFVISYRFAPFGLSFYGSYGGNSSLHVFRIAWTIMHIALAITALRQRRNPELKEPWLSHSKFNMTCMLLFALVPLLVTLVRINAVSIAVFIYIASFIFCIVVCISGEKAGRGASGVVPPRRQDDGEAS